MTVILFLASQCCLGLDCTVVDVLAQANIPANTKAASKSFCLSGRISRGRFDVIDYSEAIVYLTPRFGDDLLNKKKKESTHALVLELSDRALSPSHIVLRLGQELVVMWDGCSIHLLQTFGNKTVIHDHGNLEPNTFARVFAESDEGISLKCMVERRTVAHITVISTPYYVRAEKNGKFAFPNKMPVGTYILSAFDPAHGHFEREVRYDSNSIDFGITLEKLQKR